MITLTKLKWSNLFSYGADNELDLQDNSVTQILGTNGTGKSSIPLVIEEALYNKNSKGIKKADIPNRALQAGYNIYLEFFKEDTKYEIYVDRKSSVKVKLLENGEDISSHTATNTYKQIQEIIGMDFKTFSQLVYQNPNTSLQFLTATDTNRKKFLIDLLHLEHYVELFELFKEEVKRVGSNITATQSKVDTINAWLKSNKLTSTDTLELLSVQIDTEEDDKLLGSLRAELENISAKNTKISQNNKYKEMLAAIDIEEAQAIDITEKKSYDDLQTKVGKYQSVISSSTRTLEKLESLGDCCPTCEQAVDSSFKSKLLQEESVKVEKARATIIELSKQIQEIRKSNELFDKKQSTISEWESIFNNIDDSLPEETLNRTDLTDQYKEVQKRIKDAKAELQAIADENERRTKHNTKIAVIQEQTDNFLAELKEAEELLAEDTELFKSLDVLKKVFSTNGLLAYKIENLVGELEDLTNKYLADLSDGRFTLEFSIVKDKLNVGITDDGAAIDIFALSSGELARVNTSTLLAIRKLMSSISKSRINILFLDEVISVLDENGKEKLVEILVKEEFLNSYLVSHQWQHPLLAKIEVIKEDNLSRLET